MQLVGLLGIVERQGKRGGYDIGIATRLLAVRPRFDILLQECANFFPALIAWEEWSGREVRHVRVA